MQVVQQVSSGGYSLCGDPHDGPFHHMAGGRYANGVIAQTFTEGQTIDIEIVITAHHKGEFNFFLCDLPEGSSASTPVTKSCLRKHRLRMPNGKTKYQLPPPAGSPSHYNMQYKLPQGVTCSRCVLQWYWKTGNSPGAYPEEFWNCADIRIESSNGSIRKSSNDYSQGTKKTSSSNKRKNNYSSSSSSRQSSSQSSSSSSNSRQRKRCKSKVGHISDSWCRDVDCASAYSDFCTYA